MPVRLLVVIIWVAWTGPWGTGVSDPGAVTSVSLGEGWLSGENLADLVAYHAQRLNPWPSARSGSGGRRRRGKKTLPPPPGQRGKKPTRLRVLNAARNRNCNKRH
jgi:hypothetical protein